MGNDNQILQGLPRDRAGIGPQGATSPFHLLQVDPQEHQQTFESQAFKDTFSDQERSILTKLSAINPPEDNPKPESGPSQEKK